MKLGTNLPDDASVMVDGKLNLEKATELVAKAGIRGCLTNLPGDESEWKAHTQRLKKALDAAGLELFEYNLPFFLTAPLGGNHEVEADRMVRAFEMAEEVGCLNVGTCLANRNSIYPDMKSRSPEYYDNVRATCELIARKAERKGLKARFAVELVYTTVTYSLPVLLRLLDEVASPNVQGHIDIANCYTFDTLYRQREFIQETFAVFQEGRFHSAHLKDILPLESYFPGLYEVLVGDGILDIRTYLECLNEMPGDVPVIIEHMHTMEEISRSHERTLALAREAGLKFTNL